MIRRLPNIRITFAAIVCALGSAALHGCMERHETWTVRADGFVRAQLEFPSATAEELYDGDAVPSVLRGWHVLETRQPPDEEGVAHFTLTAEAEFPPDVELPDHYGDALIGDPDIFLHFPTSLTVEQRRDGTYYHFHRTYQARPRSYWSIVHERAMQAMPDAVDQPFETLSDAQRAEFLRILAAAETERVEAIARRAFLDVAPDVPQDVWLAVRDAMHAASANRDFAQIAHMFGSPPDIPPDERGLRQEGERFEKDVLQAIDDAVQSSQFFGPTKFNAFARRFAWHRRYHEITEDLQDETFIIKVAMPGTIVGHNAGTQQGNTVTWRFDGPVFADRDHELMVTSVVR